VQAAKVQAGWIGLGQAGWRLENVTLIGMDRYPIRYTQIWPDFGWLAKSGSAQISIISYTGSDIFNFLCAWVSFLVK